MKNESERSPKELRSDTMKQLLDFTTHAPASARWQIGEKCTVSMQKNSWQRGSPDMPSNILIPSHKSHVTIFRTFPKWTIINFPWSVPIKTNISFYAARREVSKYLADHVRIKELTADKGKTNSCLPSRTRFSLIILQVQFEIASKKVAWFRSKVFQALIQKQHVRKT